MLNRISVLALTFIFFSCSKEVITQKLSVDWTPLNGGAVSPPTNAFEKGTVVSMVATPAGEYVFKQWSGNLSGTNNPAPITMDTDKQVTGVFEKRQYPLTLTIEGSGTVKEEVIAIATQAQYPSGTTVRLTAQPADKFEFGGWSGGLTSTANPLDVKIDKAISLKAVFKEVKTPLKTSGIEIESVDPRLKSTNKGVITVPVVVINYLPTNDGGYLDKWRTLSPTIAWDEAHKITLVRAKQKILLDKIIEKNAIEEASRFRDYGANKVKPYIDIDVVAYVNVYDLNLLKVYTKLIDTTTNDNDDRIDNKVVMDWHNIDFNDLINTKLKKGGFDLKTLVESNGVKEVWFTSMPKELGSNSYNVPESNMSSPTGDISNGGGSNTDLPVYNKTYVVYGFNYSRGVNEDLHNRGHQLERQLDYIDAQYNTNIYYKSFALGRNTLGGFTHTPPNTTKQYDYWNVTDTRSSNIMGWSPEGGSFSNVNANTWGGISYTYEKLISMSSPNTFSKGDVNFLNNLEYKWHIFWWQSIPGFNNNITSNAGTGSSAKTLTVSNWWDIFYNWDEAVRLKKKLIN